VRGAGRCPTSVNPNIAAFRPPELVESVPECREKALCFQVALGEAHQHTDPPHPLCLLRMSGERQSDRNTTEPGDELPSSHQLRPLATSGRSNDADLVIS